MNNCARKGCTRAGELSPVLLLRRADGTEFRAVLGMKICDECASKAVVSDFLGDEGWNQIQQGPGIIVGPFVRERTGLDFTREPAPGLRRAN